MSKAWSVHKDSQNQHCKPKLFPNINVTWDNFQEDITYKNYFLDRHKTFVHLQNTF